MAGNDRPLDQKNRRPAKPLAGHAPTHVFATLDGVRGVAATFVLVRHFGPFFGTAMEFHESFLAVDIFFLLSGAVISHAYERRLHAGLSVLQFTYIRLVRIYPLYILGSAISLIVLALGGAGQISSSHLLAYAALGLLMLPNLVISEASIDRPEPFPLNGPAWSLFFELAANIFYAAVLRWLTARVIGVIMLASALGMIVCMYVSSVHNLDFGWTVKSLPGGFFKVGYSFFAGVLLYRRFTTRRLTSVTQRTAYVPYAILISVAILLTAPPPKTLEPLFDLLAVVVLFPLIIFLGLRFQPDRIGARICRFFGLISYPVYVIQGPLSELGQFVIRSANGISVEHYFPWAGLDFLYKYAPWSGFGFLALLLPFCLWLNKVYDGPARRYFLGLTRCGTPRIIQTPANVQGARQAARLRRD